MLYFVLLVFMAALTGISFFLNKRDILAPSVITGAAFSFATFCALSGVGSWNDVAMSPLPTLLLAVGALSFAVTSWVTQSERGEVHACSKSRNLEGWSTYLGSNIATWKIILLGLFVVVTYALYFREIVKVNAQFGYGDSTIGGALQTYRSLTPMFSGEDLENDVSFIVLQMRKACDTIFIVLAFFFVNGWYSKKELSKKILAVMILCMLGSLLTTGRSKLMAYFVGLGVLWVFMVQKKKGPISLRQLFLLALLVVGVCALFYGLLTVVGRQTSVPLLSYVASYLGYGIPGFNLMVLDYAHFGFTGQDIFMGFSKLLGFLGVDLFTVADSQYWIFFGSGGSNIYTSLKDYYCVAGVFGVVVCQALFAVVFTRLYSKARIDNNPIWLVLYAFYGYVLVDQIRAETFFKNIISINVIIYIIFVVVLFRFLLWEPKAEGPVHGGRG